MDEAMIMRIIAEQLRISPDEIKEETTFSDLGADSLDLFQIISALEEAFHMEFDNDEAEKISTIGDVMTYIRNVVGN